MPKKLEEGPPSRSYLLVPFSMASIFMLEVLFCKTFRLFKTNTDKVHCFQVPVVLYILMFFPSPTLGYYPSIKLKLSTLQACLTAFSQTLLWFCRFFPFCSAEQQVSLKFALFKSKLTCSRIQFPSLSSIAE